MDTIYTKTGDTGETSLYSGIRVRKDDPLVEAYGTVDELNSALGLARALHTKPDRLAEILATLQPQLLELGATLAAGQATASRVHDSDVTQMEAWIDELQEHLPALGSFILPGGHPVAAALHLARTICRRAERLAVHALTMRYEQFDMVAVRYLNRLADLCFILAREANHTYGLDDTKWSPRP